MLNLLCGYGQCGKSVGAGGKNVEKNNVKKLWKNCGKEQRGKSVEKNNAWENVENIQKKCEEN